MKLVFTAVFALGACAGVTAEQPLTVALDRSRAATTRALHDHQYCPFHGDVVGREATFPRCDRTGTEWSDSWVSARYDGDRVVELRRWERLDEAHSFTRWSDLVAARTALTPPSEEAVVALRARGLLPPGTRSLRAFRIDDQTVVGVYLLTATPPEDATVLERIVHVPLAGR